MSFDTDAIALRVELAGFMARTAELAAEAGTPIPCAAGCSACCRGVVGVYVEEIGPLLEALPPAAFRRLVEQGEVSPREAVCPALDPETRRCTVYAERPLGCRAYAVTTPAELCDPELHPGDEVALLWNPIQFVAFHMERVPDTSLREVMTAAVSGKSLTFPAIPIATANRLGLAPGDGGDNG